MGCHEEDGKEEEPRTIKKSTYQFAIFLCVVLGFMAGTIFIRVRDQICLSLPHQVDARWRKEAVDKGHAEYHLDKEYERQWRWLPAVEQQDEKKKE